MDLNNFAAELSALRSSLPVQKKIIMYKVNRSKPEVGDIVVRPINVYTNGEWSDRWKNNVFKSTSVDGSYMLKATWKLTTSPGLSADSAEKEGFVCFSKKKPLPNWIYFKINKISVSGKVLFVEPVHGTVKELLSIYHDNR